ncbi:hypothetical protein WMY93_006013 [Mugilogobius chulae]|uniref:Ig-like domain-containing protein n=1 Tax=Mugilogobius chulae TaxID=88201 RepID=A0AAW0PIH3_9GOBI
MAWVSEQSCVFQDHTPALTMNLLTALTPERLRSAGLLFCVLCLSAPDVRADTACSELPVFSPSRLVVRYNHSATATCSICNSSCDYKLRLEEPFQSSFSRGKELVWNVSRVTEWDVEPICSIFDSSCTSTLEVIVYKPPERVSLSFREQGPLEEGRSYSVLCEVESVAPAQNMTVVFYRGLRELSVQSSSSDQKSPVNQSFSLDYRVSREDHGAQFWCQVRLELGPEGPQPPPVVSSQSIRPNVLYKPCCEGPAEPQIISVTQGQSVELNCSSEGNPQASRGHSVLIISSASSEDQGLYTCTAENALGLMTRSFSLQVHDVTTTSTTSTTTTPSSVPSSTSRPAPHLQLHISSSRGQCDTHKPEQCSHRRVHPPVCLVRFPLTALKLLQELEISDWTSGHFLVYFEPNIFKRPHLSNILHWMNSYFHGPNAAEKCVRCVGPISNHGLGPIKQEYEMARHCSTAVEPTLSPNAAEKCVRCVGPIGNHGLGPIKQEYEMARQ